MSAGILGRRTIKHRRSRRKNYLPNQPQPATPIFMVLAEASGVAMEVVFDQPISLNGLPGYTAGAAHVTAATQSAPNSVTLTFSAAVGSATKLVIPYQDPAIRNSSGGYVTSNQIPLPLAA